MSHNLEDQTMALAGVFQAASLVNDIATKGDWDEQALETSLGSVFQTNPERTLQVYGDLYGLRQGLKALSTVMGQQATPREAQILRYGLNLIQLESKLQKSPDMLSVIGERIEQAQRGVDHFGMTHPNVIRNLASVYLDTLSTFRLRINVNGHQQYLQVEDNAARIRACLLAGIRSAMLWRQLGGRRWQLIFRRARVVESATQMLRGLD